MATLSNDLKKKEVFQFDAGGPAGRGGGGGGGEEKMREDYVSSVPYVLSDTVNLFYSYMAY